MKIRITGTDAELNIAERYYTELRKEPYVNYVEISKRYPNRGDSGLSRIYVEVSCWQNAPATALMIENKEQVK